MSTQHLDEELRSTQRVPVETALGIVTGARAANGSAIFLEVPYALPPVRFQDPQPLPPDFRYQDKEYTRELSYCVQPKNDGQARGTRFEDKVGFGKPSENPLFLNIAAPPCFPETKGFPVKVYIHGGFLQYGSPHGLGSQAQYISAERSEVWVNIGYRLSVFGFLASDSPPISGNFGFKDQWLALLWIKENIISFGGDPENIEINGLSAGAHSVHQLLHFASHLPDGVSAPFSSAVLQSNAIVCAPRTPAELRPQFQALCNALHIDPFSTDALSQLQRLPADKIVNVIETDALGIEFGTFRGCWDGTWLPEKPNPMQWQRTGGFAHGLRAKGVKSIVIGDLTEEWYLYSIAHPVKTMSDVVMNLERYFSKDMVARLMEYYEKSPASVQKLFGDVLSDSQVHLPVRILARDLHDAGFPFLRYEIRWTPEQLRPEGYVTHGSDRALWAFRVPDLTEAQVEIARSWLARISEEVEAVESAGKPLRGPQDILALGEDRAIEWSEDSHCTRVLKCDPGSISFPASAASPSFSSSETQSALELAAHELVQNLRPVAFPTETVYGLGALALDASATSKIFSTKGRPADNPLIVHVSSFPMLQTLLPPEYILPATYTALIKHFWPGPLTLLFPCDPNTIPPIVTAGQPTVAIRMPSHPVARALIAVSNTPLAAPSANSSGKPSPTKAEHVYADLNGKISLILDGGACDVGLESTVVDGLQADGEIRVLRPGGVTVEDIERVLQLELESIPKVLVHKRDYRDEVLEAAPTTPGMKYRHYSPAVPVNLLCTLSTPPTDIKPVNFVSYLESLKTEGRATLKIGILSPTDSPLGKYSLPIDGFEWLRFPLGPSADPAKSAHLLFDGLLTLERQGADMILIEEIREEREGLAFMNRVRKAAGECVWLQVHG
ncbi:Carboxylic ester hydrolase [Mycena indigotica]|uniref:Threonylcarbamoyl-AMP synthase n=1 Tax=Mycena indigotica TaxID=2126181 RepID=A0A8H6T1T1_9AGAR|nr:Carboxylic ester hydrolase [Mycena indigotica]KAF7309471.1 Carboxylic ester hydrolase [Mycena indigotica]